LVEHALLSLADWGVQDVLINLHHAPQEILAWFRTRSQRGGPRITFSFEPEILGTGGALRKASFFIGQEPCWLVNTDIAFVLDPHPLVQHYQTHKPPAVLWLDPERGPRTVACDAGGRIRDFAVPVPGIPGTYTYCGIQLFHPKLIAALPKASFCSVIDACRNMMRTGHPVYGCVVADSYWADLGTPGHYLQAHADAPAVLRERGRGLVSTRAADSVLWDGARIMPGGRLKSSIAGRNVQVHIPVRDACVVRADLPGIDAVVAETLRAMHMSRSQTLYVQLPRRGSDRQFVRLVDKRRSVILVRYRCDRRPENARYAGHARFLALQGIPVPRVWLDRAGEHVLALEDVGSDALQDVSPGLRDSWYRRVMRVVVKLHAIPLSCCPELEPGFDAALFAWEHELFLTHFMPRYAPYAGPHACRSVARELRAVSDLLVGIPPVLLHRDLQSSNILLHRQRPVLIDFQGMRSGPAVYDLASLLYDPYAMPTGQQRDACLAIYLRGMDTSRANHMRTLLPVGGIQRLVQALGAFGRLAASPETARFGAFVPVACRTLQALMVQTGLCPTLSGLLHEGNG